MGFLGSFGDRLRTLGSKALGAVKVIGSKVATVADKVGDVATRVAPALPGAFGDIARGVAKGANIVSGVANTASSVASRLAPGLAPDVNSLG